MGYNGFVYWCNERNFSIENYSDKWINIINKYEQYKDSGLVNSTNKFKTVFEKECYVDQAYFNEFSSREIFGKTALYSKLLIGKQTQDKKIFRSIFAIIKPSVIKLINDLKIDFVAFVPPTVKREIQLMKELEKFLNLNLPKIQILKISNEFVVAQKTLSKPSERRHNAIETFLVPGDQNFFGNILIIDDFIDSGSSINFIAEKIKNYPKNINNIKKLVGYAIAGSPNGIIDNSRKFEVLNEL